MGLPTPATPTPRGARCRRARRRRSRFASCSRRGRSAARVGRRRHGAPLHRHDRRRGRQGRAGDPARRHRQPARPGARDPDRRPEGASTSPLHGMPRPIDVGIMNGEAFAVMAGTGFDALMIRDADTRPRSGSAGCPTSGPGSGTSARGRRGEGAASTASRGSRADAACVLVGNVGTDPRRHRGVPRRPLRRRPARRRRRSPPSAAPTGCASASEPCSAASTRRRSSR